MAIKSKANYKNGKIYSIRSHQTNKVYYGSTAQLLCKRIAAHRANYKLYIDGKYHYVTSFEFMTIVI